MVLLLLLLGGGGGECGTGYAGWCLHPDFLAGEEPVIAHCFSTPTGSILVWGPNPQLLRMTTLQTACSYRKKETDDT